MTEDDGEELPMTIAATPEDGTSLRKRRRERKQIEMSSNSDMLIHIHLMWYRRARCTSVSVT